MGVLSHRIVFEKPHKNEGQNPPSEVLQMEILIMLENYVGVKATQDNFSLVP